MTINKIVVILLLIFLGKTYAKDYRNCLSSIDSILKGSPVNQKKLQDYLKFQSELTLHKLSYAMLKGENKETFRVERKILLLLENIEGKDNDKDFQKIKKMFQDPNNKISRNGLSLVLPYLLPILNEQSDEEDKKIRELFHIGESDVKMLTILAEKEIKDEFGKYTHLLSRNRKSDKSILNLIKIINSSIQRTNDSTDNMLEVFNIRIGEVRKKMNSLLESLFQDEVCSEKSSTCAFNGGNTKNIIDENFLIDTLKAVDKVDDFDKGKYLRYGDVWLHTKRASAVEVKERSPMKKVKFEKNKENELLRKSDHETVHNYLIEQVLSHMPYFLSREELLEDFELTLALSQAIDSGVLLKKGKKRVFHYGGDLFYIPELWNNKATGNRLSGQFNKIKGLISKGGLSKWLWKRDLDVEKINLVNEIELNNKDKFFDTWFKKKDQVFSFVFKGRLFDVNTGLLIPPTKKSLFSFKVKDEKSEKKNQTIDVNEISLIAEEVRNGNRSPIKDKKVFYISGAEVSLEKERKRAEAYFKRNNIDVNDDNDNENFITKDGVKSFIKGNPSSKIIITKGYTDKKNAIEFEGGLLDLVTLTKVSAKDAQRIIHESPSVFPNSRVEDSLQNNEKYSIKRASAIINKEPSFSFDESRYSTFSGQKKRDKNIVNLNGLNKLLHSDVVQLKNKINSAKSEKEKIKLYNRNYSQKCKEFTIIDKKERAVEVYSNDGDLLFKKEILIGKEIGDERTLYRNAKTRETNDKTGAGIYLIGEQLRDPNNPQFQNNVIILNTQKGNSQLSLSQIATSTPERLTYLNDENKENNRVTNGSLSLKKEDMEYYLDKYAKKDCALYVLPETDKALFYLRDNELEFLARNKDESEKFNTRVGEISYKEIKALITDKRYENINTKSYLQALTTNKRELLPLLGVTNVEYDELVKLSFGILGVETSFGESKLYKFKEMGVGQLTTDIIKKNWSNLFRDSKENSRGVTQIKDVDSYLKGEYKKRITSDNLNIPKNAAIATMFVLAEKLKELKNIEDKHTFINSENRMDYLYYLYVGSSDQVSEGAATPILNPKVSEVLAYSNSVVITTEP